MKNSVQDGLITFSQGIRTVLVDNGPITHDCICSASATPELISGYFAAYKSIVGENGEKLPAHWQFAMDETGRGPVGF